MKIDRSRPAHWLWLVLFTLNVLVAMLARAMLPRVARDTVILYGHKFNGNLRALYEHARRQPGAPRLQFLTMDPEYHRVLEADGLPALLGTRLRDMLALRGAYALVSDHGLHSLSLLLGRGDLKFVDVWHGIPFKGFDAEDFRMQHLFDEVWVASPMLRDLYIDRFAFPPGIVHVTGYARTDRLVHAAYDLAAPRRALDLPLDRKIILFAPTWQQDDRKRDIFPFSVEEEAFLRRMSAFCAAHNSVCVVRRHLNTKGGAEWGHAHVLYRPHDQYPDAEAVLLASDVLVCDWSSIAFDFLLLDRPTIFLDVPPPFRKGFSLDAGYRFGPVVSDMDALFSALEGCVDDPDAYRGAFLPAHRRIARAIYQEFADGRSAERCYRRLLALQ